MEVSKSGAPFERLVLTKDEALELFQDNPFKVQLISTKVPCSMSSFPRQQQQQQQRERERERERSRETERQRDRETER